MGSVSVAELIRRQPSPLRILSCEQVSAQGLVAELLGEPAPAGRPAHRSTRIAGLATGALVLLASVATGAILAGNHDPGPRRPWIEAPVEIRGSSALRPDVLSAQLGGRTDPPPANRAPLPIAADVPVDTLSGGPADSPVVLPEIATGPKPQVDVVRRFYELLPAKPAAASQLLSPDLVGGSPGDFVAAWGHIQAITIESTTLRPDGSVLARVSMQERSGRWIRVEQLFRLTDTTTPRIVGTEVLSAQRS